VRGDALELYGALRRIDDLVDGEDPAAAGRVESLERWAREGAAGSPEAEVLAALSRRHPLPRGAVLEFCRGMEDDLERRPHRTEAELDRYCRRVAGTVGVMVAAMLGSRRPCLPAAATLGAAMQRTNILRDVDEDAARGRVYLAEETLARLGPAEPGRREELVRDQIARADRLYDRGIAGIPALARGRWAIAAAAATYREILRQIEREGYGRRPGRAVVHPARRALVAARLGAAVARAPAPLGEPSRSGPRAPRSPRARANRGYRYGAAGSPLGCPSFPTASAPPPASPTTPAWRPGSEDQCSASSPSTRRSSTRAIPPSAARS
jgi:phytoene synthase